MVKTSKRARKFLSSGGVKSRLEKGTIAKKGKGKGGKKRRRTDEDEKDAMNKKKQIVEDKVENEDSIDRDDDLGDLEVDDFFKSIADGDDDDDEVVDGEDGADGKDGDEIEDNDDSEDDDIGSEDEEDILEAEKRMKEEMENLAKSDPEFHEYLEKNESSLLDFQDDNDGSDDIIKGVDDEMKVVDDDEPKAGEDSVKTVNAKLLASFERGAFQSHGLKALKRIISVYRAACHMIDTDDETSGSKGRYHIESTTVFNRVMAVCMTKCHEEFRYHLLGANSSSDKSEGGDDEDMEDEDDEANDLNKPIKPQQLAKSPKWGELKSSINTFMKSTLHLISESKETKLINFVLKSLQHYIQYLSAFPKLEKGMLKSLVSLWSSTSDASPQEYQPVRLNAFLRIRQMTMTQPFPFIEHCLKACYLAYAKCAKFGNAARASSFLPTLAFMGNCVVELYSLDYASSYQHAFVYIRQLALHLRTAMQKKTPETFRIVYCWQYIHCIKLWTAVLSACCQNSVGGGDDETQMLRSLVYPLVEVISGVIRLIPTTRHLPLRLHCVRFLQQLAAATECYIPTTSILLDALDLKEMTMPPKRTKTRGKNVRGLNLSFTLKLPKDDTLRSPEQLDTCLGEVFLLLNREIDLYRYSAGFPEFTVRICQKVRKFAKESKNGKYRAYAKACIDLSEKYSNSAVAARSKLEEAPKDIKRLEVLKPNNVPSMGERYEAAIEKEKRAEKRATPKLAVPEVSSKKTKNTTNEMDKTASSSSQEKNQPKKVTKEKPKRGSTKPLAAAKELKDFDDMKDSIEEGINWSDSGESDSE